MKKELSHIILLLWLSSVCFLFAQDANTGSHNLTVLFPEIALLDIESENGSDITFSIDNPDLEAGSEFTIHQQNDDLWLNYTSLVSQSGSTRSISVQSNSVMAIPGLQVSIEAQSHSGDGEGLFGVPSTSVIPSPIATQIITGIGCAFTGDGVSNGHQLIYKLDYEGEMEDLNAMNGEVSTISIIYTITD